MWKIGDRAIIIDYPGLLPPEFRGCECVIASELKRWRHLETGQVWEGYAIEGGDLPYDRKGGLPVSAVPAVLRKIEWKDGDPRQLAEWSDGPFRPKEEELLPPKHFNCRSIPWFGVSSG